MALRLLVTTAGRPRAVEGGFLGVPRSPAEQVFSVVPGFSARVETTVFSAGVVVSSTGVMVFALSVVSSSPHPVTPTTRPTSNSSARKRRGVCRKRFFSVGPAKLAKPLLGKHICRKRW